MSVRACEMTIGDLFEKAYEIDPHKTDILESLWQDTDFTTKEYIEGL